MTNTYMMVRPTVIVIACTSWVVGIRVAPLPVTAQHYNRLLIEHSVTTYTYSEPQLRNM